MPVENRYEPAGKVGHLEEVGNERTFGRHTEYAEPGHDSGNARDIESLPDHPYGGTRTFDNLTAWQTKEHCDLCACRGKGLRYGTSNSYAPSGVRKVW